VGQRINHRASARTILALDRVQRALELRTQHRTYQEIAEIIGVRGGATVVRRAILRTLDRQHKEIGLAAQQILQLELATLDKLQRDLMARIEPTPVLDEAGQLTFDEHGDVRLIQPEIEEHVRVVQAVRKLMEHRARLLGLGGYGAQRGHGTTIPDEPVPAAPPAPEVDMDDKEPPVVINNQMLVIVT
jgi:hypothetical protein